MKSPPGIVTSLDNIENLGALISAVFILAALCECCYSHKKLILFSSFFLFVQFRKAGLCPAWLAHEYVGKSS